MRFIQLALFEPGDSAPYRVVSRPYDMHNKNDVVAFDSVVTAVLDIDLDGLQVGTIESGSEAVPRPRLFSMKSQPGAVGHAAPGGNL